jgi:hypothetical protein
LHLIQKLATRSLHLTQKSGRRISTSPKNSSGKPETMTPKRFNDLLDLIDAREEWLVFHLNVDGRRFRRWKLGLRPIPEPVAAWLEALAATIKNAPNMFGAPRDT